MGFGIGLGLAGAAGLASTLFGKKKGGTTVTQVPLETPEQKEARRRLLRFPESGEFTGPLGNFDQTGLELLGQNRLFNLAQTGQPALLRAGQEGILNFLNTGGFDPEDPEGEFASFERAVDKRTAESKDRLKRDAAFGGKLFSSSILENIADVEEEANAAKTAQLAGLTDRSIQRQLQAIPLALQSAGIGENIERGRISDTQRFGGLSRVLKDLEAKSGLQDFLRRRDEEFKSLSTVASTPPQFGVPSFTLPSSGGPFDRILDVLSQAGGTFIGNELFNQFNAPKTATA